MSVRVAPNYLALAAPTEPRGRLRSKRKDGERAKVLRIGVISAYPDDDWHAGRIVEAAAREHRVDVLAPTEFAAEVEGGHSRVTVRGRDSGTWDLFLTPRALGDDGDADVQLELYRVLARSGARVVNDIDALLVALDKFRTSWELARVGIPTPEARVVQTHDQARAAMSALHDVVVKPVYGSLGIGVERLKRSDSARLDALLTARGALYLQRFVDGARLDVRAFVVGDRVHAAMAREPRDGDFRGNRHQGGSARAIELDAATTALAVAATRAVGLDYSGVDLLVGARGAEVIEVNGTPAFRGIFEATGRDMAPAIVAHATSAVHGRRESEWRKAE
jgi:tetrahydromethanopterin:alpha-L-glutamate ligase